MAKMQLLCQKYTRMYCLWFSCLLVGLYVCLSARLLRKVTFKQFQTSNSFTKYL